MEGDESFSSTSIERIPLNDAKDEIQSTRLRMNSLNNGQEQESPVSMHGSSDLTGLLSHLAVLDDLKQLSNELEIEAGSDDDEGDDVFKIERNLATKKVPTNMLGQTRFQRRFEVKCYFFRHLDDLGDETSRYRRILKKKEDLESDDIDFVREHIKLSQEENSEIR